MKADEFKTISTPSEGLYKEKGSKFIAKAFPVGSEEEIKEIQQELRKSNHDARHHCYAYALGPSRENYRYNDDGEPSGTGGKPIYGQILSFELTNVLIVVIRYFGGTKLGVSGLINAYRQAARDALESADLEIKTIRKQLKVEFKYPMMNDVMRIIKEMEPEIISQRFELDCEMTLSIRESEFSQLLERFGNFHEIKVDTLE